MTQKDLINAMAEKSGLTKRDAGLFLTAFKDVVTDALANETDVVMTGFCSLKNVTKAARTCMNFQTGESIEVPEGRRVQFKASQVLKKALN